MSHPAAPARATLAGAAGWFLPLPVDPVTGKGFDGFYQVKDGRAILEVPAPPGQPVQVGRRYELAPRP